MNDSLHRVQSVLVIGISTTMVSVRNSTESSLATDSAPLPSDRSARSSGSSFSWRSGFRRPHCRPAPRVVVPLLPAMRGSSGSSPSSHTPREGVLAVPAGSGVFVAVAEPDKGTAGAFLVCIPPPSRFRLDRIIWLIWYTVLFRRSPAASPPVGPQWVGEACNSGLQGLASRMDLLV